MLSLQTVVDFILSNYVEIKYLQRICKKLTSNIVVSAKQRCFSNHCFENCNWSEVSRSDHQSKEIIWTNLQFLLSILNFLQKHFLKFKRSLIFSWCRAFNLLQYQVCILRLYLYLIEYLVKWCGFYFILIKIYDIYLDSILFFLIIF